MHSGRKLSASDLQIIILALLDAKPAHGYELIKSLEERSAGFYVPSPGMIYPALTYLDEVGYAAVDVVGTKKLYSVTEAGQDYLRTHRQSAERILDDLARIGERMAEARKAFDGEGESGTTELDEARWSLKAAVREREPFSADEAKRIAGILGNAACAVRGGRQPNAIDPDGVFQAILNRRSMGLSRLKPDPVDRNLIEKMLEAANWAPSHGDTEPWRFTVFMGDGREKLAEIFETAHGDDNARKRAFAAPVWISIGMQPALNEDGSLVMTENEEMMAVACAVQNLHLMASSLGLAGMWHSKGISVHPVVARKLGLDPPARLMGFFLCGWPNGEWLSSTRRPLSGKVRWEEGSSPE